MSPVFLFYFLLIFNFPGFLLPTCPYTIVGSKDENEHNAPIFAAPIMKMIKVFGSIKSENYNSYIPKESETCDQHCFDSDYCILTMNNTSECLELNYLDQDNQFVIKREISGSKVSFKVTLFTGNCPAFNNIQYALKLPSCEVKYWKITESGWEWKECRDGWKRLERSDGITVCMQTFQFDEGIKRDDSQAKCKEIGTNLTGLASDDETNWIYEQLREVGVEESLNSYGYWIGAQLPCSNECAIVFSDSYTQSEYIWDNLNFLEEPNGMENCIGVMWTTEYSAPSIYSTWCETETAQGYVCGYQLK